MTERIQTLDERIDATDSFLGSDKKTFDEHANGHIIQNQMAIMQALKDITRRLTQYESDDTGPG